MEDGFLKLSRRFFSNEMWNAAREFSECEAWLDLLQSARFEVSGKAYSELIGGREISYSRGQYPAAVSFLKKRWGWKTEKKVRYFLDKLKRKGMITTDSSQGMNVITICKYEEYNPVSPNKGKDKVNPKGNGEDNESYVSISDLRQFEASLTAGVRAEVGAMLQELVENVSNLGQAKGNKKKKDKEDIKESPNGDEKEGKPSSPASSNLDYLKFNDWLKRKAPFCSNPKNFSSQITETEFLKLKEKYTGKQIADIIEQIENRKDLRKRYTNLYRTVLNWAKKEYGS